MSAQVTPFAFSLYIHIPFCRVKCAYCNFNTYANLDDRYSDYVRALNEEIQAMGRYWQRPAIKTIFIGGGTPTVLNIPQLKSILSACRTAFNILPQAEITSEANPGTVSEAYLQDLLALGVNRLSFGAQSFDNTELKLLGRLHPAEEIGDTLAAARRAGAENVNLDLIYGLPQQRLNTWRNTLQQTIALKVEHISLYSLTLEHGTALHARIARDELPAPDADLAADMYELADDLLADAGYAQYEISNWSKTGRECRHNLTYWRNQPYLGVGAGAHSFMTADRRPLTAIDSSSPLNNYPENATRSAWGVEKINAPRTTRYAGQRWWNVKSVSAYIEKITANGKTPHPHPSLGDWEEIDRQLEIAETIILGLRLTQEGVSLPAFEARFGQSLAEVFGPQVKKLKALKLLVEKDQRLRLTPQARLVGNQVFMKFL